MIRVVRGDSEEFLEYLGWTDVTSDLIVASVSKNSDEFIKNALRIWRCENWEGTLHYKMQMQRYERAVEALLPVANIVRRNDGYVFVHGTCFKGMHILKKIEDTGTITKEVSDYLSFFK